MSLRAQYEIGIGTDFFVDGKTHFGLKAFILNYYAKKVGASNMK